MYLYKRKVNKFRNLVIITFLNISILSCSFSPIKTELGIDAGKLSFDLSVPKEIKNEVSLFIKTTKTSSLEISIFAFELKENNFYGGKNLGSLESEVIGSIKIEILDAERQLKELNSSKRFNTQNLNPLAQRELTKLMNIEVVEDLNKKIIFFLEAYENK